MKVWRCFQKILPRSLWALCFSLSAWSVFAQEVEDTRPQEEAPATNDAEFPQDSNVFYNARSSSFSKDLSRTIFEGDVVAIGGGTIITADRVEVDNKTQRMRASGHVIILTPRQVFLGSEMTFHWVTGDFKISDAVMVANDQNEINRISQRILGFTPEEMEFEAKRSERLQKLERKKMALREEYRRSTRAMGAKNQEMVEDYALTLEQEDLTKVEQNPALRRMGKTRRQNILIRRNFWNATLKEFGANQKVLQPIYFRITGSVLERTNGNDYIAQDASWTPCKCDEGEEPSWGFQATQINAQVEGYVDMQHPVLTIKGVPVLYMPFLRVPIKQRRQSGFLVPTIRTGSQKTGNVFTQPVYFAFAPNSDATVTTDIFQDKGNRLGVEFRYQQRKYSGWTLNVESMRDREWIDARNTRRDIYHSLPDDAAREKYTKQRMLLVPENTWRGKQEWSGQTFLAPRLSLVTNGTLLSDHRYIGDLYLGDTFQEIFNPGSYANAFSTAKTRVHLDGKDFYLGIGSSFGDHMLMDAERFSGLQMPYYMNFQSRLFSLASDENFIVPIYGQGSFSYIPIQNFSDPKDEYNQPILGSGEWRRTALNFVSPLVREGVIRVDHFTDLENRTIVHQGLDEKTSWIQSWQTGLNFNLPIDGQGEMPSIFQPADWHEEEKGKRYLHHIMNWGLSFSARPVVVRRGPYGEEVEPTPESPNRLRLVYFGSDRKSYDDNDQSTTVEDSMIRHKRITLSTSHRWRIFRKGWEIIEGSQPTTKRRKTKTESYREKARRELEFSLDRQISSEDEMFSEGKGLNWFINRYRLREHEAAEPVYFDAHITYDFVQEEERKEQIRKNRELAPEDQVPYEELPRAWTGPNTNLVINWAGFSLSNQLEYDIYLRTSRKVALGLSLPAVLKTQLGLGVTIEKTPQRVSVGDDQALRYVRTKTQYVTLGSQLIPYVNTSISLGKKTFFEQDKPEEYESKIGFEYMDDSECWGLRFLRSKAFDMRDERSAEYLLQLSIIFMGQQRDQDISPVLLKAKDRNDS